MILIYYHFFLFLGFIFSTEEKTALIQTSGGPCAVIAPVQAFLLKNLINCYNIQQFKEVRYYEYTNNIINITYTFLLLLILSCKQFSLKFQLESDAIDNVLAASLAEILCQCQKNSSSDKKNIPYQSDVKNVQDNSQGKICILFYDKVNYLINLYFCITSISLNEF